MIRVARAGDAPAIAAIYAPIVAETTISFEERAPDAGEMAARIVRTLERYPWLVDERDGTVAAYVYASEHRSRAAYRWAVEVTAYADPAYRGRGIASVLYRTLFRVLAVQGFHAAFAGITLPNDASVALHRSVGFTPVGVFREIGWKHGAWRDTSWWQRTLGEPPAGDPVEPVPFAALDPRVVERALAGA